MTDIGVETRLVPIGDRQIVVRQLIDAQYVLLGREAKVVGDANSDGERKLKAVSRIMDLLESAVVQEEDREYLIDLNIKGGLTLSMLLTFVTIFSSDEKPAVRRGRPRVAK
jgi:hypothetical protein